MVRILKYGSHVNQLGITDTEDPRFVFLKNRGFITNMSMFCVILSSSAGIAAHAAALLPEKRGEVSL